MEEKNYNNNLHGNANYQAYLNAKSLRQKETEAEKKLWSFLRNRQLNGKKFRRQHAFGVFILDFYCHECKLVIELDGSVHKGSINRQYDEARTSYLKENGITVIRFYNSEVMKNIEGVLGKIKNCLFS